MTPKQRRFVDEYLANPNATQAATRAGYSARSAASIGFENLRKPEISEAIRRAEAARSIEEATRRERVLAELAQTAFANILDFMEVDASGATRLNASRVAALETMGGAAFEETITQRGTQEVARRTVIRMPDKVRALEHLARHLGLFPRGPGRPPTRRVR